eukprot:15340982-Ditylum_brightwellii.AAC.1
MMKNNIKENRKWVNYKYKVGDKVLTVKLRDQRATGPKLSKPTEGPYVINQIHRNGMVIINRGAYKERIHMHRLKPPKE